jgi:GDPmannose 4,6-dehydratase
MAAPSANMKTALITGITGQDGSYLAEFLLGRGDYLVVGLVRHGSTPNTGRLEHLPAFSKTADSNLSLRYGDLVDGASLMRLLENTQPDEIYNLAAMSHVGLSFEIPEYTADVNALGTVRLLEAIRTLGLKEKTRFYQASSSELFGLVQETPQREITPFYPRSPYACAKLYAYWTTVNYREAYGIYAANGILFNHESPRRGHHFVTRKITRALSRIHLGLQDCLYLGNLEARRDWGHSRDYVEAQWLILQQPQPDDFVIATGQQRSVRDFVTAAALEIGLEITWRGAGLEETGIDQRGRVIVKVDSGLFRPAEVDTLLGDSSKAREKLGWRPRIGFAELVRDMMRADLAKSRRESLIAGMTAAAEVLV